MDIGGGKGSGGPGRAGDLLGGLGFSILFLFVLVGLGISASSFRACIAFSPLFLASLTSLRSRLVLWLTGHGQPACLLSFPFSSVTLRLSVLLFC
jgi:hypothetical protein